jgi:hypothetical protein
MDLLPEPASPCRRRSVVGGALPVYELWWTRCMMTMSTPGHGRRCSGQRRERKQRRVRGRVVMHMPAVSSETDLLPRWRGGRDERAAADSLRTGRGGGRRVRNDDEADPDAQMRAERTRCSCPCPCARGAAQCRARRVCSLPSPSPGPASPGKSVSVAKSVLAGGEGEGSTPAAADGRGRGKGTRTVERGYVRKARAARARQGRREGAMPMRTPLTRYGLRVRGEDWRESTPRMLTRPVSSRTSCTPVLSPPSLLVPVLGQFIVIALVLEPMKRLW